MKDMATDKNDQPGEPVSPAGPPQPALDEAEPDLAAVAAERDRLAKEKSDLGDQLLRARAEFDNFRRRTEREKRETWRAASMDMVRHMLPVLDALELALKSTAATDGDLRRGVELTLKQFRETLEKQGLKAIPAAGAQFDPNLHHAVEMVETEDYEDHTVIEEYARGYLFQDQLLRPAMVRVACRPEKGE
jgi:molecular chaperone GrpE